MTRQYAVKTNQSGQKDNDSWILQRAAVRELPAKTVTPQTKSPAGDRPGIKVDLMQIPNYSAKPSPLQADAKAHNSVAEETVGEKNVVNSPTQHGKAQVQSLGTKGMPVAQGDDGLRDRETPVGRQEQEKKAENKTGLPDRLKEGIESMSGYDLSGVRVNYNSPKPAQLNAHAYTQGHAIEVAPGQERHLPHEAWHVVQQMQGRVTQTMEVNGVGVNGDRGLEREAEEMGVKAMRGMKGKEIRMEGKNDAVRDRRHVAEASNIVQRSAPTYGPLNNGQGTVAKVTIEGKKDIGKGSSPSVDASWYSKLNKDTQAWFRKNFVRGHLLNDNLGGPGNTMENLAYITKSANTTHLTTVEKHVKDLVLNQDKTVYYEVKADYATPPQFDLDKDVDTAVPKQIGDDLRKNWELPPGWFCCKYDVYDDKGNTEKRSDKEWIKNEGASKKGPYP